MWTIDGSLAWELWVIVLAVAFAVGWVVYFYVREATEAGWLYRTMLATIRLTAIFIVAFVMLAELIVLLQRSELPYAVIMVDVSASMNTPDRFDDEELRQELERRVRAAGMDRVTRLNLAKTLLIEEDGELLAEIEKRYKLKVYFVASATRAVSGGRDDLLRSISEAEPSGESSRLGLGIRTVLGDLRGTPPAAIILLTDGINTDGETISEAAAYARRKNVPLLTVGLGSDRPQRNLKLSDLLVDDVVFVNDPVIFEATLRGTGFENSPVEVLLKDKKSGDVLAQTTVTVDAEGRPQTVRLPYRPTQVGEFEYEMEVRRMPGEIDENDNSRSKSVSVRKEQIRVLLVQSYPSFEYRYLKHMLERDSTIELNVVLQEADLEYAELDKSALRIFPVSREELFKYDCILFGDVDRSQTDLTPTVMQNIADFVQLKGGGIAFICGPRYMPVQYARTVLSDLFPIVVADVPPNRSQQVYSEGFVLRPTDLGLSSPTMQLGDTSRQTAEIWTNLPPLYWMIDAPTLKPGARVLATHPTRLGSSGLLPLVCMQYVGAGKVLMHLTDETWRWRFRVGDVFLARYWVQTIRYLSRSKLLGNDRNVELTADPSEVDHGESVRLRVRFFDERTAPAADDAVTVLLEREGHPARRLTLHRNATNRGVFEGVLSRPSQGIYHAWIVSPTLQGETRPVKIEVKPVGHESERTQMDVVELTRAAKISGGKFYRFSEATELWDDLPQGRMIPMDALPPWLLWDSSLVLLLLLSLLVAEWLLRKKKGML
ncbi:MAG: VWA domain-containing protein [Planctomycetes bacterium]|nr:VWA domain-containing protein [Planctomycetota bacterium]